MALTYGFFNSVSGDRVYNAEQMSEMFDGLISDGVFQNVGGAMRVVSTSGMTVNVSTGRARINSHWAKIDAAYGVTLNSSHVTLNRYTAICLRVDISGRKIEIIQKDSPNATFPVKPTPQRDGTYYEMILAYVYVRAGATSISQSNIEDTRPNTNLCGIVSSLVQNLDTSELYNQYVAAYNEQLTTMQNWFTTQRGLFDNWFESLTEELRVDTHIETHVGCYTTQTSPESQFFIPDEVSYVSGDVLLVFINGIHMTPDVDYEISGGKIILANGVASNNTFTFVNIKSVIGEQS